MLALYTSFYLPVIIVFQQLEDCIFTSELFSFCIGFPLETEISPVFVRKMIGRLALSALAVGGVVWLAIARESLECSVNSTLASSSVTSSVSYAHDELGI